MKLITVETENGNTTVVRLQCWERYVVLSPVLVLVLVVMADGRWR